MKKLISVILSAVLVLSLSSTVFAESVDTTNAYDYSCITLSENRSLDNSIITDENNHKVKLVTNTLEQIDTQSAYTDIIIDLNSIDVTPSLSKVADIFENKTKVYLYCDNQNETIECANTLLNDYYDDLGMEITALGDVEGFVGCSLEIIDTQQTVLTYYFDTESREADDHISMMMKADSAQLVYDQINEEYNVAQLSTYGTTNYTKVVPTIVHNSSKSEMQSIFYFERIAVGTSETLWDVNNVINLTPKGDYETLGINCWLNVNSSGGERLIGFGPSATVNSSSTSYTVSGTISGSGGSIGASRNYSVSLADIQCTPEYSSSTGNCKWMYAYSAGTTSSKGSSVISNTVRVANSKGTIEIHPATNYIIAETYWLFGWHYGTSAALYLETQLPSMVVEFNDIK